MAEGFSPSTSTKKEISTPKDRDSSSSDKVLETNNEGCKSAASIQKNTDMTTGGEIVNSALVGDVGRNHSETLRQDSLSIQAADTSGENECRGPQPPSGDQQQTQPLNMTASTATTTTNSQQRRVKKKRHIKNNRSASQQQAQNSLRHIMISYNHSTLETCRKICDDLRAKHYNVWMDQDNMRHNVLLAMGLAVENSYIVLLCINRKYCKSRYCKLEAEYAVEKQVKCIPCFMQKPFDLQGSSLGIIKGANLHIDFSAVDKYDESFKNLIDEITHTETELNIRPRCNPAVTLPSTSSLTTAPPITASATNYLDLRCRFDAVVRNYKTSIRKKNYPLVRLSRLELVQLINRLRKRLFTDTSQTSSSTDISDTDDDDEDNDGQSQEIEDNDDQQQMYENNSPQRRKNNGHLWQDIFTLSSHRTDQLIRVICHLTLIPSLFTVIKILFIMMILRILYVQFFSK